jgi:F-type H+-transporting ATPase subunit b
MAATDTTQSTDLFSSIGINWKLLILQTIAFLILLWFLKKFVYPPLVAMLDKREAEIAMAAAAAREAQNQANKSEEATKKLLAEARAEAKDIVATAKEEAGAMLANAETKSKAQAEHIVAAAHDEIAKEVIAAKKALHNETIDLVVAATEKVVGKTVNANVDTKVIETSLKESK